MLIRIKRPQVSALSYIPYATAPENKMSQYILWHTTPLPLQQTSLQKNKAARHAKRRQKTPPPQRILLLAVYCVQW